jgi:hypothetical protein
MKLFLPALTVMATASTVVNAVTTYAEFWTDYYYGGYPLFIDEGWLGDCCTHDLGF